MGRQSKPRNNKRKAAPSVRNVTYEELCDKLHENIVEAEAVEDTNRALAEFEINEKETPCHVTDDLLDLRFIAYASLKRYPPQFVLSNYGYHEGRFKNRILQYFGAMKIVKK